MPDSLLPIGPLDCHVVRFSLSDAAADRALVFCHGFGAPGDDLVPLAAEIARAEPALAEKTLFLFPQAPLAPEEFRSYGGRAWWPLDMLRLQRAMQSAEIRDLRNESPPRLPTAREELTGLLAAVQQNYQLPMSRIVLGGFSQGSMLATDVALRLPEPPAALVIYSGTLLNEAEWKVLAPRRRGLKVLQSHGRQDPILPFVAAEWLRDMLLSAGLDVTFVPFAGDHTIPAEALRRTIQMLKDLPAANS